MCFIFLAAEGISILLSSCLYCDLLPFPHFINMFGVAEMGTGSETHLSQETEDQFGLLSFVEGKDCGVVMLILERKSGNRHRVKCLLL